MFFYFIFLQVFKEKIEESNGKKNKVNVIMIKSRTTDFRRMTGSALHTVKWKYLQITVELC